MVLDSIRDDLTGVLGGAAGHTEEVSQETGTHEQFSAAANEVTGGLDPFQGAISGAIGGSAGSDTPSGNVLLYVAVLAAIVVVVGWS